MTVACDPLSADVLTFGRAPVSDDLLARHFHELAGTSVAASWDPALSPALSRHRLAIPEQRVLDDLPAELMAA